MKTNWIKSGIRKLQLGLQRFTESIILSMVMTIFLIITIEADSNDPFYFKTNMALIAAILMVTDGILLAERTKRFYRYIADFAGLALAIVLYFLIPDNLTTSFMTFYLSLIGNLAIWFVTLPYVFKKNGFGFYSLRVALRAFVSVLYGLVLFAGVSALVFAVETLFELNFSEMIYLEVLVVSMVFVAVTHFLSTIEQREFSWTYGQYPKVIRILLTMIVIPLIMAFTLIIYSYFLRILITFQWPKGVVGQLVTFFGIAAWMTLFLLDEVDLKKKWQLLWQKFFPYTFILPVIMLFIAIFIRIRQHGVTQLRYYVVLGGIWFSINLITTIFLPKHKNMFYALSASVLLLIASIGPLSSVQVSFRSQEGRVRDILVENGLLDDGVLIASVTEDQLSSEDNMHLYSALDYLDDIELLDQVAFLPEDFNLYKDYEVAFGAEPRQVKYGGEYVYYESEQPEVFPVSDGYVIPFNRFGDEETLEFGGMTLRVNEETLLLILTDGRELLYTYDELGKVIDERLDGYEDDRPLSDLRLEFDEKSTQVIIQIMRMGYNRTDQGAEQMEGFVIIQ